MCDNTGSERDVFCEYELRKRPFRADFSNVTRLSEVNVSPIPDAKLDEVKSFFSKVSTAPLLFQSKELSERYVTVMSYEKLRVMQRMVICGQYIVPTTGINITREVEPDQWMKNPATNKLYYFSPDALQSRQAEQRCREMNATLGHIGVDSYRFILSKIAHNDVTALWWVWDDCNAINFAAPPDHYISYGCDAQLKYICEKNERT